MFMTPWVQRLLLANVGAFVLTLAMPRLVPQLLLLPAALPYRPWTAVTYMFLHGGIWHLGFNMLALFFFGPRLEMRLGGRHFLGLYFVSGLMAAAVSFVFTPGARIVGASGAVLGVLLGFARYWPRARLLIWGVFPMEARWLVAIMAAASLFFGFSGSRGGIAHFAHLGGLVGGFVYLWILEKRRGRVTVVEDLMRSAGGGRERRRSSRKDRPSRQDVRRWREIDPEGLHEVNRQNLERLWEKLDREGAGSLTERERAFLERMRQLSDG